VIESIRGRESSAPRTILGFLIGMYGVLVSGSAAVILGLTTTESDDLIVYVLIFIAVVTLALGLAVLVITWKDPSRLMLGQITGREYAAIRHLTLGDDVSGERVATILGADTVEGTVIEESSAEQIGPETDGGPATTDDPE
jgi:hypothetical protein